MKTENQIPIEPFVQELRRGTIVLAAMSCLREAQYGYSLLKSLADQGFEVDQGTLYPLLRRLEANGLLESDWRLGEARQRRYYILSEQGKQIFAQLASEWQLLTVVMDRLLTE